MLKNKHILLGVTGGIAAYKIPFLVRELKKAGAAVRVVMTEAATQFVTPLVLSTLSGGKVVVGTFPDAASGAIDAGTWHIELGRWADLMLIAPATANLAAKLAHGYADDAVSTLALAARCPLVISPAMDADMLRHSATQENLTRLRELGYTVLPPEEGELASGLTGPGRLPEISAIVRALDEVLGSARRDLRGKRILITAGPTREAIDPVRFLGNRSSGKMGFALANAAALRGAEVTLVSGAVSIPAPRNVRLIGVETADQMLGAVTKEFGKSHALIMAAAVSDFKPAQISRGKIKKEKLGTDGMTLRLERTPDILGTLSAKKHGAVVVGFALETDNGLRNAKTKLKEKKLDLIVLNNPLTDGAGFNSDTNVVTIISKSGKVERLAKMQKFDVANRILDRLSKML
ncbi:MAG TPA: bifunctional phosphopantothenoylcysteine decarboxylase/phosphopantothenate--cysteine ligase CoaBC [Bacteroidota bacterium]|jgi:phosphopantothenoylcysteine decarboxylase/phosphopantothenate--cysteine ligase